MWYSLTVRMQQHNACYLKTKYFRELSDETLEKMEQIGELVEKVRKQIEKSTEKFEKYKEKESKVKFDSSWSKSSWTLSDDGLI